MSPGDEAHREDYSSFLRAVLHLAHRGLQRAEFLHEVSKRLLGLSQCDVVHICVFERSRCQCSTTADQDVDKFTYEVSSAPRDDSAAKPHVKPVGRQQLLEALCGAILAGRLDHARELSIRVWGPAMAEAAEPSHSSDAGPTSVSPVVLSTEQPCQSAAGIPFALDGRAVGLLVLSSKQPQLFDRPRLAFYEGVAQLLGMAMVQRRTQLALRERVKELSCLYGISKLVSRPDTTLDDILQSAVELFPPAWLYPEITCARVVLDGRSYETGKYQRGGDQLRADLVIDSRRRGFVEVSYTEQRPPRDEGPFLREERHLIDAVAREVSLIVEQRQAEQKTQRLQDQLRHADRLATIGQLSAGVAHELNEPLGSILGFAQLAMKQPDISEQSQQDLDKIVAASLHAREIIGKLMLFARQTPPKKDWVNLNTLVGEGLYFLESRCAKCGIELVREFDEQLPEIAADPSQLYQVLVNLAVNATQAMPEGGRLTIRTGRSDVGIFLSVQDTGIGMAEDVKSQMFVPFFTTKDVGEGTGLGLSVADGIVRSHGGYIAVDSTEDVGTKFTVHLPVFSQKEAEP